MKYTKGILLILATSIISGFAIFLNKWTAQGISPFFFAFTRNFIVAVLLTTTLFLVYRFKIFRKLTSKDWALLALIGLIGGSVPFIIFFKGLSITTAAKASFFHKTLFVWFIPISLIFLKKKINKYMLLAALIILCGSILYFQFKPEPLNMGDLLIVIATMMWAIEIAISKKILKKLSGFMVAWGRMFFGAIFIFLYVLMLYGAPRLPTYYSLEQYAWIIISSVVLFGYVSTFYNGLKYIPAFTSTAILTLGAPLTAILSLIFISNEILPLKVLGIFMIIIGVYLVIFQRRLWKQKI